MARFVKRDIEPVSVEITTSSDLGHVSNVSITGGAMGYVLSTDGNGNLDFVPQTLRGDLSTLGKNTTGSLTSAAIVESMTITDAIASINELVGKITSSDGKLLSGTLITEKQPNITQVGKLDKLETDIVDANCVTASSIIAENITMPNGEKYGSLTVFGEIPGTNIPSLKGLNASSHNAQALSLVNAINEVRDNLTPKLSDVSSIVAKHISNGIITATEFKTASIGITGNKIVSNQLIVDSTTTVFGNVAPRGVARVEIDGEIAPYHDNASTLGTPTNRWSVIYAGSDTINTSDARSKQQIRSLNESEIAVARKLKSLIRIYKFNDSVEHKGDNARLHIGALAQDIQAAFSSEGLNAFDYAILCYDKWDDSYIIDDQGNKHLHRTAGDCYGIRYSEMLAFIIAAL